MKAIKTWSTPVHTENSGNRLPCALCGSVVFKPALTCEGFSYVRCAECGLVQMNPRPLRVTDRYTKTYGDDYLAYEIENEKSFLRLQELALSDAGFWELEKEWMKGRATGSPAPRVLDVGCATGTLLEELRGRGWDTYGAEISPAAEYARKKRSLDVKSLTLEECRFPGAHFTAILASHLIEHLGDPPAFVREVQRILAPGGRVFITTPNIDGFQARITGGRWRSAIFDHLYLFSVKTLSALLEKEHFKIERIATWGGLAAGMAPLPLKRLADKAAKRFGFGDVMLIRASAG
jgi:2-polyprenyl-3-methyl-5-hydroxy-6-metoxy-1,4-benzoquinol methylase